jgi:hypothetical protein
MRLRATVCPRVFVLGHSSAWFARALRAAADGVHPLRREPIVAGGRDEFQSRAAFRGIFFTLRTYAKQLMYAHRASAERIGLAAPPARLTDDIPKSRTTGCVNARPIDPSTKEELA